VHPRYMRPPFGDYNANTKEALFAMGFRVVMWNLDTNDWQYHTSNPASIIQSFKDVLTHQGIGYIPLQHDTYEATVQAQDLIITATLAAGFKLVTIDECLGYSDGVYLNAPVDKRAYPAVTLNATYPEKKLPTSTYPKKTLTPYPEIVKKANQKPKSVFQSLKDIYSSPKVKETKAQSANGVKATKVAKAETIKAAKLAKAEAIKAAKATKAETEKAAKIAKVKTQQAAKKVSFKPTKTVKIYSTPSSIPVFTTPAAKQDTYWQKLVSSFKEVKL